MSTFVGICVAILGAFIAWGQWHTARQKLVLDLFEKRMTAYNDLLNAVARTHFENLPTIADTFEVDRSIRAMRFLFSVQTAEELHRFSDLIFAWRTAESRFDRACRASRRDELKIEKLMLEAEEAQREVNVATNRLDPLVSPYLRMDQKLPEGPIAILKRRWLSRPTGE